MTPNELNQFLSTDIENQNDVETLKKIASAWKQAFDVVYEKYLTKDDSVDQVTEILKDKYPNGF